VSSLFASLNATTALKSGGASPAAPASAATSTLISSNVATLAVVRDLKMSTVDALFGTITLSTRPDLGVVCYSMERIAVAIPTGSYAAHLEDSPHFGRLTPHIDVPNRTYIEIHPANYPSQLEGCIAVGSTRDSDSLDNSVAAFDKLMVLLPSQFSVTVTEI